MQHSPPCPRLVWVAPRGSRSRWESVVSWFVTARLSLLIPAPLVLSGSQPTACCSRSSPAAQQPFLGWFRTATVVVRTGSCSCTLAWSTIHSRHSVDCRRLCRPAAHWWISRLPDCHARRGGGALARGGHSNSVAPLSPCFASGASLGQPPTRVWGKSWSGPSKPSPGEGPRAKSAGQGIERGLIG